MVFGVHYYEDKLTKLNRELDELNSDYKEVYRAVVEANNDMFDKIYELDKDNKLLQNQIKELKVENAALKNAAPAQYEYAAWQSNTYNSLYEQAHRPKRDEE